MKEKKHKTDGTPCWCNPRIVKVEKKRKKLICDYCGSEVKKLVGTPYLADIGNMMCKKCWQALDQEIVGTFEKPI